MKQIFSLVIGLFVSACASAAVIHGGFYNPKTQAIELDVVTTGGCGEHDFSLKMEEGCLETFPVQCSAQLVEKTNDPCEAVISLKAVLPLKKYGLDDPYFSGASLRILGDADSGAVINLPFKKSKN